VLFSDPDGLHWLASQPDPPRPALILTSASHFSIAHRETVTQTLGAPIVNYYGTTETGPIAWECLENPGRFHVLLPDVFVEESEGELLLTRLRRSVLPLLRYRTGDAGRLVSDHCACGYHGLSIVGFTGRSVCLFERPDGTKVDAWRLVAVLKYTRLRAFRLTQGGPQDFCLEMGERVTDTTGDISDLVDRLIRALTALGWDRPLVRLAPLDHETEAAKPAPFRARWSGGATARGIEFKDVPASRK
jgi:phenylacetate-CoA ligase